MMVDARRYARRLTLEDAISVWLQRWAGEFQHTIAARFAVNPGRVNDVLKGRLHPESRSLALSRRAAA
ncbi:hypothetical protein [Methylobacterium fujisawaense]|uniref:hypothetical protein n=1 Tax=Methylobacterium fujisawaense TaxID=107400 RepID=UPI00313DA6DF